MINILQWISSGFIAIGFLAGVIAIVLIIGVFILWVVDKLHDKLQEIKIFQTIGEWIIKIAFITFLGFILWSVGMCIVDLMGLVYRWIYG